MAAFTLQFSSGVVPLPWNDPVGPDDQPSRLNARVGFPHRRWLGTVGNAIVMQAIVAGVVGPPDSALAGLLFSAWFVQAPVAGLALDSSAGQSSFQSFTPRYPGHYVIGFYRKANGIEHIHVDVQ